MGEMGNRPGGGGDFGRAKRRQQDLEIARGGSQEIGEGVGLRRSTYQCKWLTGGSRGQSFHPIPGADACGGPRRRRSKRRSGSPQAPRGEEVVVEEVPDPAGSGGPVEQWVCGGGWCRGGAYGRSGAGCRRVWGCDARVQARIVAAAREEDEDDAGAAQDQARGPLRTLSCRTEESTRDALRVVRAQSDG